jgi:hypothetical protein
VILVFSIPNFVVNSRGNTINEKQRCFIDINAELVGRTISLSASESQNSKNFPANRNQENKLSKKLLRKRLNSEKHILHENARYSGP